jgi:hypothetical protein
MQYIYPLSFFLSVSFSFLFPRLSDLPTQVVQLGMKEYSSDARSVKITSWSILHSVLFADPSWIDTERDAKSKSKGKV